MIQAATANRLLKAMRLQGEPIPEPTTTVAGKPGDDLKIGTYRSILRQAGLWPIIKK